MISTVILKVLGHSGEIQIMDFDLLIILALVMGIGLIVIALVAGIRKSSRSETAMIQRLDEAMKKGCKDDPIEPARFVP